jgi:hypothetical protein
VKLEKDTRLVGANVRMSAERFAFVAHVVDHQTVAALCYRPFDVGGQDPVHCHQSRLVDTFQRQAVDERESDALIQNRSNPLREIRTTGQTCFGDSSALDWIWPTSYAEKLLASLFGELDKPILSGQR